MIEMSNELRHAIQTSDEQPVRLVDPATSQAYVLLRAEEYERMKRLEYDDDWSDETWAEASARLVNEVMAEDDANDPVLEEYQQYRKDRE